jgi:Tfp pilus assembly protein PilF
MNNKIDLKKYFISALQKHKEGDLESAEKLYNEILKNNSYHFDSNYLLGTLYLQNKKFEKAKIQFDKSIKINPNHAALCNNFGAALIELKDYKKAIYYFKLSIQIKPNYVQAHNNLGSIFKELEQYEKAIKCFQKCIQIEPTFVTAYYNLGLTFKELGNFKKAIDFFKKINDLQPKNIKAYQNLMESYEITNNEKMLKETILNAKKIITASPIIKLYEAIILYNNNKFNEAKNYLSSISFNEVDKKNEATRLITLAKCYDRMDESKNAFIYFNKANSLFSKVKKINFFDKQRYLKSIDVRKKYFTRSNIKKWKTLKYPKINQEPIFLIGFPRSGTTLLDTILRSHPQVEVIEEKPMVKKIVESLEGLPEGGLQSLETLNINDLKKIRKIYFDFLETQIKSKSNKKIYIDKLPLNIVHVAEIIKIFPNAKFILSLRHPHDCVLSCFMQNFTLNDAMANFLNLTDSANLYNVVMNLWIQYVSIFKINYHEVKYESLVENFNPTINSILSFLGLSWDQSVLKYADVAKKRKNIATPSYNQVTKPIYSHAHGRWKRYEKEIENIYPILKPWVKKFDY